MHEINQHLNQLPNFLRAEVVFHSANTAGLTPVQLIIRYRWAAGNLIAHKQASFVAYPAHEIPHDSLTNEMLENMAASPNPPEFVDPSLWQIVRRGFMHDVVKLLKTFSDNLAPVQTRREQEAHQQAVLAAQAAARQLAQRQAQEAARQLAQRQAAEAARQLAQRQAEEAARQLAKRKAEAAARLAAEAAAKKLAEEQAEAAAKVLAKRKADEAALEEARRAIQAVSVAPKLAVNPAPQKSGGNASPKPAATKGSVAPEIRFKPGPAATVKIEQATVKLKLSIDAAVTQYAAAIVPYLESTPSVAKALMA